MVRPHISRHLKAMRQMPLHHQLLPQLWREQGLPTLVPLQDLRKVAAFLGGSFTDPKNMAGYVQPNMYIYII